MQVTVNTPVHATEDPERLADAVHALWPGARICVQAGRLQAKTGSLGSLRERVWRRRIIDTLRSALLEGAHDGTLRFTVSKQAACAGKVALPPTPHPLGDLEVTVLLDEGDPWPDAEALAWWLCPPTEDGRIVQGDA